MPYEIYNEDDDMCGECDTIEDHEQHSFDAYEEYKEQETRYLNND